VYLSGETPLIISTHHEAFSAECLKKPPFNVVEPGLGVNLDAIVPISEV